MRTITLTDRQSEWVYRSLAIHAGECRKGGEEFQWAVDLCFDLIPMFENREMREVTFKTFDEE
jgi:hypothetical protein